MTQNLRNNSICKYLLIILILIALFFYTVLFFFKKESYDGDEIWSYGLANSYYNPFLHNSGTWDNNKDNRYLQNFNTWITGDEFHNYLTVQENERFTYDSVWYNQSADVHPPFYYALLHTICSFFPDYFSPWFGLFINYIAFIIVMCVLYKLACQSGSDVFGLVLCTFYAFSAGAEDTYTFIRMYALATALAVLLYQHIQNYIFKESKKILLCLLCITTFSCLTHYYLIVYAFFLTAISEIYLLIKKRWKTFWSLGLTMLLGVAISVLVFPSMVYHFLYRSGDLSELNLSFSFQGKLIISLIMQQFMGISFPSYETMFSFYFCSVLVIFAIIFLLLSFIFRREHFATKLFKRMRCFLKCIYIKSKQIAEKTPYTIQILCFTLICMFLFYTKTLPIASMKTGSIRYFFPFYPLLCLTLGIILKNVLFFSVHKQSYRHGIALTFLSLCVICSNLLATHTFFYTSNPQYGLSLSDLPNDGCYIVTVPIPHAINNFAVELQNKKYSYFIEENNFTLTDLPDSLLNLPSESSTPVYLLFTDMDVSGNAEKDQSLKDTWLRQFIVLPYVTRLEVIGQDVVNGYSVLIYQLQ